MSRKEPGKVPEQVVVYMDESDRNLLEEVVKKTGLSRTELFRRGLRQIAGQVLPGRRPGGAFEYLIANARNDGFPADVSERHDFYLYGGGYDAVLERRAATPKKKRARIR
jgi:hypothetical protein